MQISLATAQQRALRLLAIGQDTTEEALASSIITNYLLNEMTDADLAAAQDKERANIMQAIGRSMTPEVAQP